jgi:DNA-binding winged helix-turn-helix (wHTH) protein
MVHLTQVEYLLLRYFLQFPNELISRERLLKDIWSDGQVSIRTVDTHIAHLRKKLKDFTYNLRTVFRGGYILEME